MSYQEEYQSKLVSLETAAMTVEDGWILGSDAAISAPDGLFGAVCEAARKSGKRGIKVHTMLDVYPYAFYSDPELNGIVNGVSWFSSSGARKAIAEGRAEFVPTYYRDAPVLMRKFYDYDVFGASVAPMDENGYFSLGTVASYSEGMIEKAKRIYLEVNEAQPYVPDGLKIHISDVTLIVENTHSLPELAENELDEKSLTIGNLIAEQIPDGACIQLGIGAIPDAVGAALKNKHDLGIHTEMFTNSMVSLLKCGAVNNSKKQVLPGKTLTTFAMGTKEMYDFLHQNGEVLFRAVDYVNNPAVISTNDNMISINACVEVDFWGQVCAESLGSRHLSGTGGQADYVRGAIMSKGGKSFIAFESTAKGGTISKIRPQLASGSAVTTSKNDVDYVVTEYGLAQLRGKSLSERTKALISIAHPDFRDELAFEAKRLGYLV